MKNNYSALLGDRSFRKIFIFRFIGNLLMISSLFFITKTFFGPVSAELRYFVDNNIFSIEYKLIDEQDEDKLVESAVGAEMKDKQNKLSPTSQLASLFGVKTSQIIVPVDPNYSIIIPKIAASAKILPDIDAANENEYLDALKLGVAHAKGTDFPGNGGNVFLFAHSTDYVWNIANYNAVFYLLYKLESGDEIDVIFEGRRYKYIVSEKKIIAPDDIKYLTETVGEETLTLQTCWPPGTTLQRLLVFAKRKAT